MSKRKKHRLQLREADWRKRWHIAKCGRKAYTIFRLNAVPGMVLVRPLPVGFRFTRDEREQLISDAIVDAQMGNAERLHGVGHA